MSDNYNGLVVFVPGFMGSILKKRRIDRSGNNIEEFVWSSDFGINKDIFANKPDLLTEVNVDAIDVIRKITLTRKYDKSNKFFDRLKKGLAGFYEDRKEEELIVYGDLIDFCVDKERGIALELGYNFFLFPYDWRISNMDTADALANYIYSLDLKKEKDIKIITHSMGGIVARILLTKYCDIQTRTSAFIQIACPTTGSVKAYYTLKERPVIHDIFDKLWLWEHALDASMRVRLMRAINGFDSIYQLLPPREDKILYDEDGVKYPAVIDDAWINEKSKIRLAEKVHQIIKDSENVRVKIRCVYSNTKITDREYMVDQYFNVIKNGEIHSVTGDGTVICASAFSYTDNKSRLKIDEGDFDHTGICSSPRLFEELLKLFYE